MPTNLRALLVSFGSMTKKREALKAKLDQIAASEQTLIGEIGRVLAEAGYRLERIDATPAPVRPQRQRRGTLGQGNFKCSECERRFLLPQNLGRHITAIHGGTYEKPTPRRSRSSRAVRRPPA